MSTPSIPDEHVTLAGIESVVRTVPGAAPGVVAASSVDAARLDLNALVLSAFRRSLSLQTLGIDADFFEHGGDSLQATRLVHAISRGAGTQLPTDILFQHPTPRQLVAYLRAELAAQVRVPADAAQSAVVLAHGQGNPVFLIPALYPSPWVFRPLVQYMDLSRPVYGLRSPELDWSSDLLDFRALVTHYLTEIRRLQPRGAYSLVGYSFGALVAFEVARRLAVGGEVRDLILLDPSGPPSIVSRVREALNVHGMLRSVLAGLSRRNLVSGRTLMRLGMRSPLYRATLPIGTGPSTRKELEQALLLVRPGMPGVADMSLDDLCASLVTTVKELASPAEWADAKRFLPLATGNPVSAVRAFKVLSKNRALGRRHRVRGVLSGAITIVAAPANRRVLAWQRHSSAPLKVIWIPAAGRDGAHTHLSFLDRENVALYAWDLARALDTSPRPHTAS